MQKFRWLIVATLLVTGVVWWIWAERIQPFESYSLRYNDTYFTLHDHTPHEDVLFVAVDEPSVNRFGRWPWDRSVLARGLEKLQLAEVVILDMIFSEPTTPEKDMLLRDALAGLNSSVCGFFLRHQATQRISEVQELFLLDSALDRLMIQIQENGYHPNFIGTPYVEMDIPTILEGCSMSGAFSTLRDSDQLMRNYPIAYFIESLDPDDSSAHLYPSLGVQAMRLHLEQDIERIDDDHVRLGSHILGVDARGFTKLNFYAPSSYRILSYADLMDGRYAPETFENKIVILGVTDVGAGDMRATPIGEIPGPLLHYTFLSNLMADHTIEESRLAALFAIVLFAWLPLTAILLLQRVGLRAALYVGSYLLYFMLIRWIFVRYGIYIDGFYPLLSIIISGTVLEGMAFMQQERSSKFVRDAFSNYLSADLLHELIQHPDTLELGGEQKELTILFSDIRGFTALSESMTPQELIQVLNRYFTPMTHAVINEQGMLDKYIGDAVMAFFNAPVSIDHHAQAACRSALQMIHELDLLNHAFEAEGIPPIRIGIGINTAEVVVGNMGSDNRFNYTVIGDGVNLASRVEGLTKNYGVQILITEFTAAQLNDAFILRKIEPVKVKGKAEAVMLYELMLGTEKDIRLKAAYDQAMARYENGDMERAIAAFESLVKVYDDTVSDYFLKRARRGEAWGVVTMNTK